MRGALLILSCSIAIAFGAPSNWKKLDELEKKLKNLFQDDTEAKEMPTHDFEMKSISLRSVEFVEDAYCGWFQLVDGKALYGFNTKTIYDITDSECMELCAFEYNFYCRSADYNYSSNTCYLSSESDETQPADYSDNFNTVYFRRSCDNPEPEEESGSGYYSGNYY